MAFAMQILFDFSALLVDVCILYAVVMWWMQHRFSFPFPIREASKIFAIAFSVQLIFYLLFSFFAIEVNVRMYLVRMSIVVVTLSQAIPLTVAFYAYRNLQRRH